MQQLKKENKVSTYLNIKEDIELKTAGNFSYSVGGITRKALDISNKIYDEYYKSYEEYVKNNNVLLLILTQKKIFPNV